MKYIITFLLLLSAAVGFSQDSTYARWVDGMWYIQVHPDSVVGTDITVGPNVTYNMLTGQIFVEDPRDTTWNEITFKEKTLSVVTDSTTLDDTYYTVLVDASGGNVLLNLPPAASYQGQYNVKLIANSGSFYVTIDANGSEEIDGSLTQTINTLYNSITIVSDGSNWYII